VVEVEAVAEVVVVAVEEVADVEEDFEPGTRTMESKIASNAWSQEHESYTRVVRRTSRKGLKSMRSGAGLTICIRVLGGYQKSLDVP